MCAWRHLLHFDGDGAGRTRLHREQLPSACFVSRHGARLVPGIEFDRARKARRMRDDLARLDGIRLLLERVGDIAARQVGDLEVIARRTPGGRTAALRYTSARSPRRAPLRPRSRSHTAASCSCGARGIPPSLLPRAWRSRPRRTRACRRWRRGSRLPGSSDSPPWRRARTASYRPPCATAPDSRRASWHMRARPPPASGWSAPAATSARPGKRSSSRRWQLRPRQYRV